MLASQVPGEPLSCVPCSPTPAARATLAIAGDSMLPSGLAIPSASAIIRVSGLNNTARMSRCLRFAAGIAPRPRKTR